MSEKPNSGFKIRLDDGTEDTGVHPESSANKTDTGENRGRPKSARNISWVSYVLITSILAVMIFGYFDIRGRLLTVYDSGSKETQHLSDDLESKFSSLAVKLSNMEASLEDLSKAQTKLSASVLSLEKGIEKADKSISGITSSKADKKSVASSIKKIDKQLTSLSESIKKNSTAGAVVSAQLKSALNELDNASIKFSEEMNSLSALLDAVKADKASKKDLLAEIDHIENVLKTNQAARDRQAASILQTLQRLDMRTNALEVKTGVAKIPGKDTGADSTTPSAETGNAATSSSASPSLLEPGELIERDISQ